MMATKTIIVPEGMEFIRDEIGYAPAVLVNDTLYIAGQIGRNDQREQVADKEAHMRDLPLYLEVRNRYMQGCYPAWTAIGAALLCGAPGYFLELKAIAIIGRGDE
jgi:enamine deaminase RidA (YjgF/YER057c/UK114 family)